MWHWLNTGRLCDSDVWSYFIFDLGYKGALFVHTMFVDNYRGRCTNNGEFSPKISSYNPLPPSTLMLYFVLVDKEPIERRSEKKSLNRWRLLTNTMLTLCFTQKGCYINTKYSIKIILKKKFAGKVSSYEAMRRFCLSKSKEVCRTNKKSCFDYWCWWGEVAWREAVDIEEYFHKYLVRESHCSW